MVFLILDSDDSLVPNYLSYAKSLIDNVNCNLDFFHIPFKRKKKYNIERQNFCGCQVFVKTNLVKQFPFIEDRRITIGEDWLFILKINARCKLYVADQVFDTYNVQETSSMKNINADKLIVNTNLILKELSSDELFTRNIIKNVSFELFSLASLLFFMNSKYTKGWKYLIKSFYIAPTYFFSKRGLALLKRTIL